MMMMMVSEHGHAVKDGPLDILGPRSFRAEMAKQWLAVCATSHLLEL